MQVFVPNEVKLFGSAHKTVYKGSYRCGIYTFTQDIYITQTHIKALDKPSRRCTNENAGFNTAACLATFIERQIGCTPDIQGSQYPRGSPCSTKSHLNGLVNITGLFYLADENEIYGMTGCLSACEKEQYFVAADPIEKKFQGGNYEQCEYHVRLKIMDRSYEEEEQYVIYDTDSFFADVGGYMGLLLGTSLISLYKELEALLKKLLCRSHGGGEMYVC